MSAAYKSDMSPLPDGRVQIKLPSGAVAFRSPNGRSLTFPNNLPIADWKAIGRIEDDQHQGLQQDLGNSAFRIGDWWHYGQHEYGERARMVAKGIIRRFTFGTLRTYGWVCGQIPASSRLDALDFGHIQEIARLETLELRRQWLEDAARNKWSVATTRQKVSEYEDKEKKSPGEGGGLVCQLRRLANSRACLKKGFQMRSD